MSTSEITGVNNENKLYLSEESIRYLWIYRTLISITVICCVVGLVLFIGALIYPPVPLVITVVLSSSYSQITGPQNDPNAVLCDCSATTDCPQSWFLFYSTSGTFQLFQDPSNHENSTIQFNNFPMFSYCTGAGTSSRIPLYYFTISSANPPVTDLGFFFWTQNTVPDHFSTGASPPITWTLQSSPVMYIYSSPVVGNLQLKPLYLAYADYTSTNSTQSGVTRYIYGILVSQPIDYILNGVTFTNTNILLGYSRDDITSNPLDSSN